MCADPLASSAPGSGRGLLMISSPSDSFEGWASQTGGDLEERDEGEGSEGARERGRDGEREGERDGIDTEEGAWVASLDAAGDK